MKALAPDSTESIHNVNDDEWALGKMKQYHSARNKISLMLVYRTVNSISARILGLGSWQAAPRSTCKRLIDWSEVLHVRKLHFWTFSSQQIVRVKRLGWDLRTTAFTLVAVTDCEPQSCLADFQARRELVHTGGNDFFGRSCKFWSHLANQVGLLLPGIKKFHTAVLEDGGMYMIIPLVLVLLFSLIRCLFSQANHFAFSRYMPQFLLTCMVDMQVGQKCLPTFQFFGFWCPNIDHYHQWKLFMPETKRSLVHIEVDPMNINSSRFLVLSSRDKN